MSVWKYLFLLAGLVLVGCHVGQPRTILPDACLPTQQGHTITGPDGSTERCLLVEPGRDVIEWSWSADGRSFAYALRQPTATLPVQFSNYGVTFPTEWYIADGEGRNVRRFEIADYDGLGFSDDGQYIIVTDCWNSQCRHDVYDMATEKKICQYSNSRFVETDCPIFRLRNGQIWDVRPKPPEQGCVLNGLLYVCPNITPKPQHNWPNVSASGYPSPYEVVGQETPAYPALAPTQSTP